MCNKSDPQSCSASVDLFIHLNVFPWIQVVLCLWPARHLCRIDKNGFGESHGSGMKMNAESMQASQPGLEERP